MLSTLGKHNFANIFEGLVVLQANQDSIVSNLKCICDSNKSQSVEDLMNKLVNDINAMMLFLIHFHCFCSVFLV